MKFIICPECEGQGEILDAPSNVLGGRAYWDICPTCRGKKEIIDPTSIPKEIDMVRQTHTYVVLEVSQQAFDEIHQKLAASGYQHTFHDDDQKSMVIDMHGIALKAIPKKV